MFDLDVERQAIRSLNDGIEACRHAGDNGSRELLEKILHAEEDHANWLETQLGLLETLGDKHYLAHQLGEE